MKQWNGFDIVALKVNSHNEKTTIKDVINNNMVGKSQLNVVNEMKKKWKEKCEISVEKKIKKIEVQYSIREA